MKILFCCDPLNSKRVDSSYEKEYLAAKDNGFDVGLVNIDELIHNENARKAICSLHHAEGLERVIYRGWMLKPSLYQMLYQELLKLKNMELINDPNAYIHCHYLPESYKFIEDITPKTVWIHKSDMDNDWDRIHKLVGVFEDSPVIVKDFVKSRKHEWDEACYIPNALDKPYVEKVVKRFMELQGDDMNEGLVFREFVPLEFLTYHSKSQMPLTKELRIFFMNGKPLQTFYYWDEGNYGDIQVDLSQFLSIGQTIESAFFTMDIAKKANGGWIVVELGDGQVAGLPDNADVNEFYSLLKKQI